MKLRERECLLKRLTHCSSRYMDDKERFEQLQEVVGSTNVYKPALLLVAWDDETPSAICQRVRPCQ